ncbi:MAG: glycine cleavage system protein R [Thiotrichales bacterium]
MNASPQPEYMVITATGEDKVGLVEAFTSAVTAAGCNIEHSRMAVLGGQFAFLMLVAGEEPALVRLAEHLPPLSDALGLAIVHKRTHQRIPRATLIPYDVEVVALDHPGIVHGLARFFARHEINIEALETETYPAPHTGTQMFAVRMVVGIPATTPIKALRQAFLEYCDDLNLDATLEPSRE